MDKCSTYTNIFSSISNQIYSIHFSNYSPIHKFFLNYISPCLHPYCLTPSLPFSHSYPFYSKIGSSIVQRLMTQRIISATRHWMIELDYEGANRSPHSSNYIPFFLQVQEIWSINHCPEGSPRWVLIAASTSFSGIAEIPSTVTISQPNCNP